MIHFDSGCYVLTLSDTFRLWVIRFDKLTVLLIEKFDINASSPNFENAADFYLAKNICNLPAHNHTDRKYGVHRLLSS